MTTNSLNNPLRLSMNSGVIDIKGMLGDERSVVKMDLHPSSGNVYVHWEYDE